MTFEEIKQIVEKNGQLRGWDFNPVRAERAPVLWEYADVVRQYLKPTDHVLDIGTGGGEIFGGFSAEFQTGIGIDENPKMIETAQQNLAAANIQNITLERMNGSNLRFEADSFDVVLLRHLRVYVDEVLRVLRPGGYFITQLVGQRTNLNTLHGFGWTPASFGPDWWQTAAELATELRRKNCRILAEAEYDVPYWFSDVESYLYYLMAIPLPEKIVLEQHWQNIDNIITQHQTDKGIESNEHQGLLVVQKLH